MAGVGHCTPQIDGFEEECEYYHRLYKAVLNPFKSCIPPVPLIEHSKMHNFLSVDDMAAINKKNEISTQSEAAGLLLDTIKMKPGWFEAFIEVLSCPELKLVDFKERFIKLKRRVDEEWSQRPRNRNASSSNVWSTDQPSRPQRELPIPIPASTDGRVFNDFSLIANPESGLLRDCDKETSEDERRDINDRDNRTQSATPHRLSQDMTRTIGAGTSAAAAATTQIVTAEIEMQPRSRQRSGQLPSEGEDNYTDAMSPMSPMSPMSATSESSYESLIARQDSGNVYDQLVIDTVPDLEIQQPSDTPQQEVGSAEASLTPSLSQPDQRPQRPTSRDEHPSLRRAISDNPQKDFDASFVIEELSPLPGWSGYQEEHEIIHVLKRMTPDAGCYVMWYWALAKRPTICVKHEGKIITFVIHKSASRSTQYYINRHQQRSPSLRALMKYHFEHGILYEPKQGEAITIRLTGVSSA